MCRIQFLQFHKYNSATFWALHRKFCDGARKFRPTFRFWVVLSKPIIWELDEKKLYFLVLVQIYQGSTRTV